MQDADRCRFQWVVCQLDMLRNCMTISAIRKKISDLAKSLDGTYDQILLQIDEEYQPEVLKTLQAITVTEKPLTLQEIVEIIAVDLDANPPQFDPDNRLLE